MNKHTYVGGLASILMLMVISCQNNTPTSPQPQFSVYVQIDTLDAIIAQEDEIQAVAFELFISNEHGQPVHGVPFHIWVESGPGATAYRQSESDFDGIVQVLYYLTVPFGDTTAVIKAVAGTDTTETAVSITGYATPASITITAPDSIISNYGEPTETTVSATLLDRRGNPLSDRDVLFAVIAGQVDVGGTVQTDRAGVATTVITSNGYWSGDLTLVASVIAQDLRQLREQMLSRIKIEADRNLADRFLHGFAPLIDSEPLIDQVTIQVVVESVILPSATIEITGGNPNYWVDTEYVVITEFRDAHNDPVAGVDVTLQHSLSDSIAPTTTNRNGVALFSYKPIRAGVEELTVTVEGSDFAHKAITFPVFSGNLTIRFEVERDTTNNQDRDYIIRGRFEVELGRGLPNEQFYINTTFGRLEQNRVATDSNGNLEVDLQTNGRFGIMILNVEWWRFPGVSAQTALQLDPHPPDKIEFPELIHYDSPGDSTFNGTVIDRKGRNIESPTRISLELLNFGSFSNGSSVDTVMSSNGAFNVRVGGDDRGCIDQLSDDTILRMTVLNGNGEESHVTAYSHFIVEG